MKREGHKCLLRKDEKDVCETLTCASNQCKDQPFAIHVLACGWPSQGPSLSEHLWLSTL